MTPEEIMTLFIKAAETDRKLPVRTGPKGDQAINIGYVHTVADMNGWSAQDKHAANWAWLDPEKLKLSRNDLGLWEAAMEVIKLCGNEGQRRALWAWAKSKAGGESLAHWAKHTEHVLPATAEWRAKRAIRAIHQKLSSNSTLHIDFVMNEDLSQGHEISDKKPTITAWRDEETAALMPCYFDQQIAGISIKEIRSAKRRVRNANGRQEATV